MSLIYEIVMKEDILQFRDVRDLNEARVGQKVAAT